MSFAIELNYFLNLGFLLYFILSVRQIYLARFNISKFPLNLLTIFALALLVYPIVIHEAAKINLLELCSCISLGILLIVKYGTNNYILNLLLIICKLSVFALEILGITVLVPFSWHLMLVGISVVSCCLCFIQVLLTFYQDNLLHKHKKRLLFKHAPPLLIMERLEFSFAAISFISLTSLLMLAVIEFNITIISLFKLKFGLSIIAWAALLALLVKRKYQGIRGRSVLFFVLLPILSLAAAYINFKFFFS